MERSWYLLKHQIIKRSKWFSTLAASGVIPSGFPEQKQRYQRGCDDHLFTHGAERLLKDHVMFDVVWKKRK